MKCYSAIVAALFIALAFCAPAMQAQDISRYVIRTTEQDVFEREVSAALATSSMSETLPGLGCTVEYIRRLMGEEIVYRRGPIDMHTGNERPEFLRATRGGTRPESAFDTAEELLFGGILVDLPRPGETDELLAVLPGGYRYMLRVALIPHSYEDNTLSATVLLERAVVREQEGELEVYRSEVFSRNVELAGNLPLKFDLPEWDSSLPDGGRAVPTALHEGVLITLETPHQFSLPGGSPDPFKNVTSLTYAVPQTSAIRLSIQVDGEERIVDEGTKEAGTYTLTWNAEELPDNTYTATLTAMDEDGNTLYRAERELVKQKDAKDFHPDTRSTFRSITQRFVVGTESGIAYQLPVDNAKSLRNMFTHVVLRLGYRFSESWEAGLVIGQDAFHETPGESVDTEAISDYGGVVGYTYGYAGPYLRWTPGTGLIRPFVQVSAAWSNSAMLAETAVGASAEVLRHVELYVAPAVLLHLRTETSTKLGIHYGIMVSF